MSLEEIKKAVQSLDERQLAEFRIWFGDYDDDEWDRQMKSDAAAGKLDQLFKEADEAYRAGRTLPAPGEETGDVEPEATDSPRRAS